MHRLAVTIITALFLVGLSACPNPYRIAWITASGVRTTAEQVEKVLASRLKTQNTECLKKFQPRTKEYAGCIQRVYIANVNWIKYYRPAINSSLISTVTGLQLAEASKDKTLPWKDYLIPSICALSEVGAQWQDLITDPTLDPLLKGLFKYLTAATCKRIAPVEEPAATPAAAPRPAPAVPEVKPEARPEVKP